MTDAEIEAAVRSRLAAEDEAGQARPISPEALRQLAEILEDAARRQSLRLEEHSA